MMRRRRVEVWEGRGSSGGSVVMVLGFRERARGGRFVGWDGGGEGGAVPTSAKEKVVEGTPSLEGLLGVVAAEDVFDGAVAGFCISPSV